MYSITPEKEDAWLQAFAYAELSIFFLDKNGIIIACNLNAEDIAGLTQEKLAGKPVEEILYPEEAAAAQKQEFTAALAHLQSGGTHAQAHSILAAGSPAERIVLWTLFPCGSDHSMLLTGQDITDYARNQKDHAHTERLKTTSRILCGITHQVQNPLFIISETAALLMENTGLPQDTREGLEVIRDQAERIRIFLDKLRRWAFPPAMNFETTDINAIIRGIVDSTTQQIAHSAVTITAILAEELPAVKGNAGQLREALTNLVINALSAMPHGGTLRIETTAVGDPGLEITVRDTGCGIPAKTLRDIMLPTFSSGKGMGMGVPIADSIIRSHHGSLDIHSEPNKGTTCTIRLPGGNNSTGGNTNDT